MHRPLIITLLGLAALLAGCGASGGHPRTRPATIVLDFTPNAIHAGIYTALARGYDRREQVSLHVLVPSASTDSIKLLEAGRADFALLDIHDLAIARERGADIVAVMALVQRPLAAVIAAPTVITPRSLAGRPVGITGVPSDTAVLDSIVSGAGGDPRRVRTITIGFNAVAALLSGRIAAATAFWNDEGVTLGRQHRGFHAFRVERYGAPAYPELLLCTTRARAARDAAYVRRVIAALRAGYGVTMRDPRASAAALESQVPGLDPSLVAAELTAEQPVFAAGGRFGRLDPATLQAFARWELRFGVVHRPLDVAAAFDTALANR